MRDVRRAPVRLNVALALLSVGFAGLGWLAWQSRAEELAVAADRQAAMQTAATHAINLLSLDHRTLDSTLDRILATSTGEARAGYETTLRQATLANKSQQTGVLRGTGLTSFTGTTAQALVVADSVIDWADRDDPAEERFTRWRMTLVKESGKWLVAKAELVR
ncbi:hypothetical protein GCM10009555_092510 [Acrocarpospora macrocephala]|uniref:Mce-associated membrane protein n=1 Tax=Acrocarpospora macrocephala TaxID=150177 RepID=A0A5M3X577_9ACTN|nr:hypothetical protein [Acrocarpospora macrocephala]GES16875.1 hypothetical protein Amac_104730 [Acrocarpospora macrocephala]